MSVSDKVWSTFAARKGDLKFCILNSPKDRTDEAIELYMKYYLAEEAISKTMGIKDNKEALKEYRELSFGDFLKNNSQVNIMICCVVNGDGSIGDMAGVNFSYLSKADKPIDTNTIKPQSKLLKRLLTLLMDLVSLYSITAEHGVEKSLDGWGITVHPDYRGLGIAQEFLKSRRLLSKEQGVPITGAWMTSVATQKAATRDGYETVLELNLEDFGNKHGVVFEDTPKVFKFMIAKVL